MHCFIFLANFIVFVLHSNEFYPLARREAATAGRRPAGEGANIDWRLVPYMRDAMRTKSCIEFIYLFIYLYIYIYASTVVLMRAALEFWPW